MFICEVVGTVFASQKNPHLAGNRLLLLQPLDLEGEETGREHLALDLVDAGVGDLVLMTKEGGGARIAFDDKQIPLQTFVVGVIDELEIYEHLDTPLPPGEKGSTEAGEPSITTLDAHELLA